MQPLELVGYTADLASLVVRRPDTGERHTIPVTSQLVGTMAEVLEATDQDERLALLADLCGTDDDGDGSSASVDASTIDPWVLDARLIDAPSAAAALVALGQVDAARPDPPSLAGSGSRLSPSELQRMLRAGRSPEAVAEHAEVSLDWVLRWYQPIAAEQRKVIASVRGGRQEKPGLGLSDDLIGEAVRNNLLARDIDADDDAVRWSAARPEGRPYWTVTVSYPEGERTQRATWRYDIGTGTVTPRDDAALELGWTKPVTHPSPGRQHFTPAEDAPPPPPARVAPPPPPARPPVKWEPPTPPASPRTR